MNRLHAIFFPSLTHSFHNSFMLFYVLLLYRRMVVDIMLSGDSFLLFLNNKNTYKHEKKSYVKVEGKQKGLFIDDKSNWNFKVLRRFQVEFFQKKTWRNIFKQRKCLREAIHVKLLEQISLNLLGSFQETLSKLKVNEMHFKKLFLRIFLFLHFLVNQKMFLFYVWRDFPSMKTFSRSVLLFIRDEGRGKERKTT